MATTAGDPPVPPALSGLPGDEVRRVLWRFDDRPDLQEVVRRTRAVARGPVARAVAGGARNTIEWTPEKDALMKAFDDGGVTAISMEPDFGGLVAGPKNLAIALTGFELAWVDGGAATGCLATNLALSPIHERGTPEQVARYQGLASPPGPGEDREIWRGSFALTEPLPNVGVNTGVLGGRVTVKEWPEGGEPILHVEKRGRFITNMATARFVTAAVASGDPRIKGTCMVVLEEGDPGTFDRGRPSPKMVHQLSSTRDPIFRLDVPADRIVGGYAVQDGVIVPNHDHRAILAAVFRRTRVTVGLFTAAKVLSAVEPVVRYQRARFRGGEAAEPGTPLHELGLQLKEDALHRLAQVWATGEASASLGFATARLFDELDPLERERDRLLAERGVEGARALLTAQRQADRDAVELLQLEGRPSPTKAEQQRLEALRGDLLVRHAILDAQANVLCPATKLWNTGHGVNTLREAVSLTGGIGITEEAPGFLGMKWMDSQLEATYEGPEAVQRLQLAQCMTSDVFLALFRRWVRELREVAGERPETGACPVSSAMELWLWSLEHLLAGQDADGRPLYSKQRQGVSFAMADALAWLLASRQQVLDVAHLARTAAERGRADELAGTLACLTDLCHLQAGVAAGEVSRTCAELLFGYRRHPSWEENRASCYGSRELVELEGLMPGLGAAAVDVVGLGGAHPDKAGPCARIGDLEPFERLRRKLDGCLTGTRLAKDRAAAALSGVPIPERPDYPA